MNDWEKLLVALLSEIDEEDNAGISVLELERLLYELGAEYRDRVARTRVPALAGHCG